MKNLSLVICLVLFFSCTSKKKEVSQWRGENRTGIYDEANLLTEWPADGPALLWENDEVGNGYGSPVITDDKLFVNGEIDSLAYLIAFDLKGTMLWKTEFGKDWMKNYIGSRSAPTVVDGLVYVASSMGDIACIDSETGMKKWGLNMIEKFKGKNTRFGYSQSLEIDGDLVYCAPGGEDVNIVALDRFTGETKWTNKAYGEVPAYCSPTILEFPTRNVLVTFSDNALFGLESTTGKLLWSHMQDTLCDIHGNTPIYENGHLYYVAGCGNGTVKLEISKDGSQITEVWRNKKLDNIMGGAVKVNDKIFASGHRKKKWKAIDATSGKMVDSLKFGRGATIAANGLLYCYNEQGKVALVKTEPNMEIISQFRVKKGTKEHFAQPVINNGILYIRHGKVLLAYDIKAQG